MKKPIEWPIRTEDGTAAYFDLYFSRFDDKRYVIGVLGDLSDGTPLVRIESACIFGHVFQGVHCDCGTQWRQAIERIVDAGTGMLIYSIDDDARGHGIETHFDLYVLRQHEGIQDEEEIFDMWDKEMDVRDYGPVVETLSEFDVDEVELMTNNPERVAVLEDAGIEVVDRVPLEAEITEHNCELLLDEKDWMGYNTSYRTHEEWVEVLSRRCDADRGYLLVVGQREVVDEGYGRDAAPDPAALSDDGFHTLYVTPAVPDQAVREVRSEVDEVVEAAADQLTTAASAD